MWPKITCVERGSNKLQSALIEFPWQDDGAESGDERFDVHGNSLTFKHCLSFPVSLLSLLLQKQNLMKVNRIDYSWDYSPCSI